MNESDKSAFYALGVNIARQVSTDLKPILTPAELEIVLEGFGASIKGLDDEMAILEANGPKINEILTQRAQVLREAAQSNVQEYVSKFMKEHPEAIKTPSGMIYHEVVAGLGKKVSAPAVTVCLGSVGGEGAGVR